MASSNMWAVLEKRGVRNVAGFIDSWARIQRFGTYLAFMTLTEETLRAITRAGQAAGILPAALNPQGRIFDI